MPSTKVIWVGDSLSIGTEPNVDGFDIDLYGKIGRNSSDTLAVLRQNIRSAHKIVVFDAGTNDDPSQSAHYRSVLKEVVKTAGTRQLVIATINRGGYNTSKMNDAVHDVAEDNSSRTGVVEWEREVTNHPNLLTGDGTHPTPAGYQRRASMFESQMKTAKTAVTDPKGRTSTKVSARQTKSNATWWKQKKRFLVWEYVGMRPNMTIDDLVLTWDGGGKPLTVTGAITALNITRSIEGASEVSMTISDPHGALFSEKAGRTVDRPSTAKLKKTKSLVDDAGKPLDAPTLTGRAVELVLDDVTFRLSKVSGDLNDNYILTFEDRMVYWLRRKKGAVSASRGSVTRAEFILKLVREVKTETIPFLCPQLKKKQPQAKADTDEESLSASLLAMHAASPPRARVTAAPPAGPRDSGTNPNFHPKSQSPKNTDKDTPTKKKSVKDSTSLTVKGQHATRDQKSGLNDVMEAAFDCNGATEFTVASAVCTVITEVDWSDIEAGTSTSKGYFQLLASTAAAFHVDPMDHQACTKLYMEKGFTGEGGAIDLRKSHPDWKMYQVCQHVQGSGAGRASDGQSNYGPWVEEAKHWVEVYKGGADFDEKGGKGGKYRKSYRFHRDKDENSWECGLRLADEVQWRLFPIGRALMYSSEQDLFKRQVAETVNKGDPRVLEFPWDMDWNKSINESSITVLLKNWSAYPGTCIMVDGYGAPDGRWLVTEFDRDWYSESATFTIKQPMTAKKEPAAEVGEKEQGVSGEGTKGEIGNLYAVCKHISDGTPGYVWGGQHGVPFEQMSGTKGLDCSSSTSLALWRADLWDEKKNGKMAYPSWDFDKWGKAGSGHLFTVMYNHEHVWIQFEEAAGMMYKRFDTSGHGDGVSGDGPKMRKTARTDQARFQKRHWPGM